MADEISTFMLPIPLPQTHINYGVHATTYQGARRFIQRYSEEDAKLITEQAARLGIPVAAFVKDSAINMARALKKQEKDHGTEHDLRSG